MADRDYLELLVNLGTLNYIDVASLSDADVGILLAEYHLKVPGSWR